MYLIIIITQSINWISRSIDLYVFSMPFCKIIVLIAKSSAPPPPPGGSSGLPNSNPCLEKIIYGEL